MRTKTKISLRIDDDLLKVLKNNSTGNIPIWSTITIRLDLDHQMPYNRNR
jgi:hypothetical protein